MQISMYVVRVRFVRDARGPLEAKPGRVVITIARDHAEALANAEARFDGIATMADGLEIEYESATKIADTVALEGFVYA